MQFNSVVATNEQAIRLAEARFAIVGRLPGAFHWGREYVDALVMFKELA
jgi:hypothetical protein